jgi:hypothetical protein
MGAGHGEKLSRKQEAAVAALLTHGTILQAAEAVGLSERTLRRWLAVPEFRATYNTARRQVIEQSTAVLGQLTTHAALALGQALRDDDMGVRVRAAKVIFDTALRGVEVADLEARIAELEPSKA